MSILEFTLTCLGPITSVWGHPPPHNKNSLSSPTCQSPAATDWFWTHWTGEQSTRGTGTSRAMGYESSKLLEILSFLWWSNRHTLTHAVLHHHESTFIAFVALAFKVPWGVHTLATATEVGRYAALINVCTKAASGSKWVSASPSFLWNKDEESKGCPFKVSPLTDLCSSVLQSQEQSHCRTYT